MQHLKDSLVFLLWLGIIALAGCNSENAHFCSRYEYVYNQLHDKDLLPYPDLKTLLLKDIQQKGERDKRSRMMLFALEDYHSGVIPEGDSAKEYCMRSQAWDKF